MPHIVIEYSDNISKEIKNEVDSDKKDFLDLEDSIRRDL